MSIKKQQGLNEITRYNLYPSAAIQGAPAPGYSSGQAIKAIQEVAAETLPHGYASAGKAYLMTSREKGTSRFISSSSSSPSSIWSWSGSTRVSSCRWP